MSDPPWRGIVWCARQLAVAETTARRPWRTPIPGRRVSFIRCTLRGMTHAHVERLLRAVRLEREHTCACGYVITHVGVALHQPEPEVGDFSACPECLTIYQLDDERRLHRVAERNIPHVYLVQRDRLIHRLRRTKP